MRSSWLLWRKRPNLLVVEETSRFWKAQSVLVMSQKSWSLCRKLMVFSSSVIFGGPGGCSARKWKTLPFSNGFHLWSSEILVVVLQEMVGNEQNGRHGIIDKGAAKPGFCNSKMFFFSKSFPHLLRIPRNQASAIPRWFFWNIISTRLKSKAAAVLENHCYLLNPAN